MEKQVWMVRAGGDNQLIEPFKIENVVGIGWDVDDLSECESRDDIKKELREGYPDWNNRRIAVATGQIYRFVKLMKVGDVILSYDKSSRMVLTGFIEGDYEYNEGIMVGYPHLHKVKWVLDISRDDFSVQARNSMGSTLTVFNLDQYLEEIESLMKGEKEKVEEEKEEGPPFHIEIGSQALELVADKISDMDPDDFQDLVGAVIRSVGYSAKVGKKGPDRGVDIVAGPDSLFLKDPRIKVQVKHRGDSIGGEEIRSFIGTLQGQERGLYVSTGGYTKDARYESERATNPVTLLDLDEFVEILLKNYEKLETEYKNLIPLKKIYVPLED
jgi:restriction system protein